MASSSALLSELLIKRLDYLGLVASICKELKIAETIDTIIPKSQDCHVTHGQALVAMILNGLGFHSSLQALHQQKQLFVTRVPVTLRAAKTCVSQFKQADKTQLEAGFSGYWCCNDYADVPQKWLVLCSEKAKQRELKTLDKRLLKQTQKEHKAFQTLCQQSFATLFE